MAIYKGDNHGKEAVAFFQEFHAKGGNLAPPPDKNNTCFQPSIQSLGAVPPGVHPDSPGYGHKVPRK